MAIVYSVCMAIYLVEDCDSLCNMAIVYAVCMAIYLAEDCDSLCSILYT